MTPQERDVIAGIFDRLKQAANQPRDPEAERFIADRLREQPYAPYAMAQAVYVQEQALTNLNAQVEELQAQVRDLQERSPQAEPAQSGGFLSGIFGGGGGQAPARPGSVPSVPPRAGQTPSGAWTGNQPAQPEPQPGMGGAPRPGPWANQSAPGTGGGFMASALTTAAGVAGGVVLGNVLANAFGGKGGEAKAATPESAQAKDDSAAKDDSTKGDNADAQQAANDQGASDQASYDQASYDEPYDPNYDDGLGGDDGDWT